MLESSFRREGTILSIEYYDFLLVLIASLSVLGARSLTGASTISNRCIIYYPLETYNTKISCAQFNTPRLASRFTAAARSERIFQRQAT